MSEVLSVFAEVSEQKNWSPEQQVDILLAYIDNQQSDEAFMDFLEEQPATESNDRRPLGLDAAIAELGSDPSLTLFECEIGLFDLSSDPSTPFDTARVAVSAVSAEQANEKAREVAEESIPTVSGVAFAPTYPATQANQNEYL